MKRFIRYLYEYEGNQKKRNVGFVKVEQDGKETTISVHGKGLCGKSNENISCYLIKLDSEMGNILFVPAGEIQIGMISCGGCFCYTEELIRAGYGKTEQSVGQTCEKKDDICGLGLGDPKEAFYVALWNEEMYGDLDIARAKVFQEFDSDKTAGESKSIKSIDEKEAEVETQFGDDEETENLEEEHTLYETDAEEERIEVDVQTELLNKEYLYQNGIPIAKHILEVQADFYETDQQIYIENGTMLILQNQGKGIFLEDDEKVRISVRQESMKTQSGHTFEIGYIENGKPLKLDAVEAEQYEVWLEGGQKEYFPYFKNISSDRIILNYHIVKEIMEK